MLAQLLRRFRPAAPAALQAKPVAPRFNPKVRWWSDREWLARYERHLQSDARPDTGDDFTRILDRRFTLAQFARATAGLPGHTAECGVYGAVGSAVICETLAGTYQDGARHWAFDSFRGLPAPGGNDARWKEGDLAMPEQIARARLAEFSFVTLMPGWIPESLAPVAGHRFRLVHIDVDLEIPTRAALAFFYPRLVPGGVIVFDEYGFHSCPGSRVAVDEVLADKPERVIELTTGQAALFKLGSA